MAGFEGIRWAPTQLRYELWSGNVEITGVDAKVCAVNRSIHYGLFLAFEGIRFRCSIIDGRLHFTFMNLDHNINRLWRSMSFQLAVEDQHIVPDADTIKKLIVRYMSHPDNRELFMDMARTGQQGYLRPFTVDEEQSIGVTFPRRPCLRMVAAGYDQYLGEPFDGVVIPHLVRAVGINGTGELKLGVNYLISVKAVAEAKRIHPGAGSALFLDDRPYDAVETRKLTEWDSSCCLVALTDGSFVKIPESPLILPSITIRGIRDILKLRGHEVLERDITFGELEELVNNDGIVTICSVGTAGILNRVNELHLFDGERVRSVMHSKKDHPSFRALGEAREHYWKLYTHEVEPLEGHLLEDIPALEE